MAVGGGTAVGVHGTGKNYGTLCDYIEGKFSFILLFRCQVNHTEKLNSWSCIYALYNYFHRPCNCQKRKFKQED